MSVQAHKSPMIESSELSAQMAEGTRLTLLDVRTPAEFEALHIPGSYNVPLHLVAARIHELVEALGERVVLVCQSGSRSRQAERSLQDVRYRNIQILDGGVTAWEAQGLPVVRGQDRWSMERQVRGVAGGIVLASTLGGLFVRRPIGLAAAGVGAGLLFSAISDTCGMAALLARLPYNRSASCNVDLVLDRMAASS